MFVIRLASVPAGHPYVDAVVDPAAVRLLPDPTPHGATLPGQWWPPRFLDDGYLRSRITEIDVLHVHFGYDTQSAADLTRVTRVLGAAGVPLVLTVHDLHNPHFADPAEHLARLDVLVSAADEVVTLTAGAATEIGRRWRRRATVLPHPHLCDAADIGARRVRRGVPVVAVHGKSLRANVDPWPLLDVLAAASGADYELRFDLDEDALRGPRAAEAAADRLAAYRAAGVDVRVHPRFDDARLAGYLADVDVLVLPYRFGTHSGWVEDCHDAGVVAVVPDCGHFAEQHGDLEFGYGAGRFDADGLRRAIGAALRRVARGDGALDVVRRERRTEQRRQVRARTVALYRRAMTRAAA